MYINNILQKKGGDKMEDKKVTKISLSIFLLILATIVIIIMSYFLYKFYNEKTTESQKVTELTSEINNLQTTTNNLPDKLNNISNTINSNSNNTANTNSIDNTSSNKIKENENISNNSNTTNKSVKYKFESVDNAAARGYPKILNIYELTENDLSFEYNSGFDFSKSTIDRNLTGTARANAEQLYEYEENVSGHQYKLMFEFNDKKDIVKVYEYDNGRKLSEIELWR